ncbi:hypothetical protein ABPG74_016046 [Tetrahymena malaccensis]
MFPQFQEHQSSRISLKLVFGGDCFRLSKFPQNFQELEDIARNKFDNKLPENFCFKYQDSENDSINIESPSDYEAFLEYCNQEKLKAIKLRIDSKSFKQYFNWQEQQQQAMGNQPNFANQGQQSQAYQTNNVIGMLLNPFTPYYQSMQNKNQKTQFQISSQDQGSFYGNIQNVNTANSNDLGYNLVQMLMCMLNTQGNLAQKSSSTTNCCINNNGYTNGNNNVNVNFNNNNNAVNNSASSQLIIPSLSRGASEANANDIKRSSVNHSYSANMEQNISFANERRNVSSSLSQQQQQQNNQQNIMASFANVKPSITKNAIATSNQLNQYILMQNSQPFNSANINDLNITSKFGNQDLSKFDNEKQSNTRNLISGQDIPNPMIDESDNEIKSKDIKKISSMSCGLDDMPPALSNHLSFTPGSQNIFNNSQNINVAAKSSLYLKQAELNSSTISNNVDTRSQTTGGGHMGSNYSANNINQIQAPQGFRINEALLSSQYTNQAIVSREQFDQTGKESIQNQQFDKTIENDFIANNYIKREFSPSPPLSQNNTLANSTNNISNMMQSKIRPAQITPPLRSGQSIQVPCEKCMIWDEEQKNNPSKYNDKNDKTPTSNIGKDIIPFTPCPECVKCGGSGFLKIEDPNTFNLIQTIVRHKLKEAEIVLKSLTVRQQKVEKIIPKESMDWLQKILQIQCSECISNRLSQKPEDQPLLSPFTPSQQNKDNDFSLELNNKTNLIQKNMHLIRCSGCQIDLSQQKFIYFCIDCKSKNSRSSEGFSKRWQDDIDFDNIICENCEDSHDSNHRVVQFCKDDIMIMHSNLNQQGQQNQQSLTNTPIQRTSQLDRSIKAVNQVQQNNVQGANSLNNNMNNTIFQGGIVRKPNFTQSTNLFTFPQQNNALQIQKSLQGQLETSTYIGSQPQNIQLQQQQSIIQAQLSAQSRQELSQRNSVDLELLSQQQQNLHKMRSKSDNKSVTTIIKNTSREDQFDYFNDNHIQDDSNVLPRCSTNQKIIKKPISGNTSLNALQLNNQQVSCVTANFNQDDEPPTFNDSSFFKNVQKNLADNSSGGAPSSANIISSPVVSQHPLVSNTDQQQTNQINFEIIPPAQKNEIQLINESSVSKKQKGKVNISENVQTSESPEQSQNLQNSKLNNTNDFTLEEIKSNANQTQSASSSGTISNSICVKSQYTTGKSLTQSVYGLSSSRPSLTPSGQKQGEDQRQYRAKLVNSYCSSDILVDDSVIVFQEILNNGNENWPENVYLKCISGITDNCQYPVVQVNKGEIMSIAFPIKINQSQATDGEQIKTAWRLYHQQQNEERKFFGPKITIDFQYKKPKKIEIEQSLEFIIESAVETIKNIFNKDNKSDIVDFVKQNQQIAQNFLQDNKDDRMVSKVIIKYIELYVTFKNNKGAQDKLQDL